MAGKRLAAGSVGLERGDRVLGVEQLAECVFSVIMYCVLAVVFIQ
jgi:hypothetical protein